MPEELFTFSKDMTHIRKMLKPSGMNASRALFDSYEGILRGGFDALGTHRYGEAVPQTRATLNVSSVDSVLIPPEGFVQYVFYAHVFHDGIAAHNLWLTVRLVSDTGGAIVIKVSPNQLVAAGIPVETPRVIVIPPRGFLQGRSLDVVGVAESLTLQYLAINVPLGEYVLS